MKEKKKKITMPHIYALLFGIIAVCTVLTWVLPAGEFQREMNSSGREVVVPNTFHYVESSPVGIFDMLSSVYRGMMDASGIIFFVFITYSSIGLIIDSGALHGLIAKLLKVLRGKSKVVVIPIFIAVIGIAASTIGAFEEFFPFIPIFVGFTIAMGYDAIVGLAIVALGAGLGFSGAFMNPFNVGVAQSIAELPLLSGSWFRILDHFFIMIIASIYTIKYALKIEKNPELSYVYGDDFSSFNINADELDEYEFDIRQKAILLLLAISVAVMVYGSSKLGWYLEEISTLLFSVGIISSIIMRWSPDTVAKKIAEKFGEVAVSCLVIGVARGILIVLDQGNIIDTIVYGLSLPLAHLNKYLSALGMFLVQLILTFLIPSGSGQAATSMPIMTPLSDILGISRQVAVLAFQFGDGISDIIWPTANISIMTGIAGIKIEKWWKFYLKLFLILLAFQAFMIIVAVAIGYN